MKWKLKYNFIKFKQEHVVKWIFWNGIIIYHLWKKLFVYSINHQMKINKFKI